MPRLSDINAAAVQALLGNRVLSRAILDINAANAATVKTTNAIVYSVGGVIYNKATLSAQSIAVTHNSFGLAGSGYVQPAGTTVYYTLSLNAAGTVSVAQGTFDGQRLAVDPTVGVGALGNMGTSFIGDGTVPDAPAGYTPFGLIKIVTSGAATFTPGSTALDAANVAATYWDISVLPAALKP